MSDLDNEYLKQCVPWTMTILDNKFLRQSASVFVLSLFLCYHASVLYYHNLILTSVESINYIRSLVSVDYCSLDHQYSLLLDYQHSTP